MYEPVHLPPNVSSSTMMEMIHGGQQMTPMLQLNSQPIEKQVQSEDGSLDVVDIFHTIQGEGPYAGRPAVFVRLAGCNLQCPMCDTDYTSNRRMYSIGDLLFEIQKVEGANTSLIVLTGGEPFRQRCGPFIRAAVAHHFEVQIETNGTIHDTSLSDSLLEEPGKCSLHDAAAMIVCSPKAGINKQLKPLICAYKYIIREGQVGEDGLPTSALDSPAFPERPQSGFLGPIYLQPCDEGDPERNKRNLKVAVQSCLKFGYTLCLQIHKIAELP